MKHTKQFFLTHLYFRESLVLATPEEYEDSVKCWFEISDGRKCRSVNLSKYTKLPLTTPNRLISLMLYSLYNGGLEKLSYEDLEYIYFQIRAYGKKYYY